MDIFMENFGGLLIILFPSIILAILIIVCWQSLANALKENRWKELAELRVSVAKLEQQQEELMTLLKRDYEHSG